MFTYTLNLTKVDFNNINTFHVTNIKKNGFREVKRLIKSRLTNYPGLPGTVLILVLQVQCYWKPLVPGSLEWLAMVEGHIISKSWRL